MPCLAPSLNRNYMSPYILVIYNQDFAALLNKHIPSSMTFSIQGYRKTVFCLYGWWPVQNISTVEGVYDLVRLCDHVYSQDIAEIYLLYFVLYFIFILLVEYSRVSKARADGPVYVYMYVYIRYGVVTSGLQPVASQSFHFITRQVTYLYTRSYNNYLSTV